MTPLLRKILGMNWVLFLLMAGMVVAGVYFIESAARHLPQGGEYYGERQKLWAMLGTVVFFGTALIDYRWIKYLALPMYLAGLGLMVAAMFVDNEVHQLSFAGIRFQPAQFMVVAGFLAMAVVLQELPKLHPLLGLPIVKVSIVALMALVPFAMVAKMGDMGSALVWLPVVGVVMLIGGVPFRYLSLMVLLGLAMIPPLFFIVLPTQSERGTNRIELYLDMLNDRPVDIRGDAYAPHYIGIAMGKAGWRGAGHMATSNEGSLHDKKYIPWKTAHNDFIFAVIGEEHGFRGGMIIVSVYGLLLIGSLWVAFYSRDLSGQVVVCAVCALFLAHVFENIGMHIRIMPITGIPLPFLSYSGTFLMMCMFMMGLIQSVWIHRHDIPVEDQTKPVRVSRRGKQPGMQKLRGQGRTNPNEGTKRGGT
ncbi:FtsW/RodA/SpoVE family cell cycle protein [Rubritalea marina]|uniref:FtsW/RodA/SpoVE family cell cycle protein n=1 Tax=Rubritalea marina TaxID=361055 RepID=UPI00036E3D36|nr:FtsW/RodA/SpoVE family cell cycle protein [Rubritalea marina]